MSNSKMAASSIAARPKAKAMARVPTAAESAAEKRLEQAAWHQVLKSDLFDNIEILGQSFGGDNTTYVFVPQQSINIARASGNDYKGKVTINGAVVSVRYDDTAGAGKIAKERVSKVIVSGVKTPPGEFLRSYGVCEGRLDPDIEALMSPSGKARLAREQPAFFNLLCLGEMRLFARMLEDPIFKGRRATVYRDAIKDVSEKRGVRKETLTEDDPDVKWLALRKFHTGRGSGILTYNADESTRKPDDRHPTPLKHELDDDIEAIYKLWIDKKKNYDVVEAYQYDPEHSAVWSDQSGQPRGKYLRTFKMKHPAWSNYDLMTGSRRPDVLPVDWRYDQLTTDGKVNSAYMIREFMARGFRPFPIKFARVLAGTGGRVEAIPQPEDVTQSVLTPGSLITPLFIVAPYNIPASGYGLSVKASSDHHHIYTEAVRREAAIAPANAEDADDFSINMVPSSSSSSSEAAADGSGIQYMEDDPQEGVQQQQHASDADDSSDDPSDDSDSGDDDSGDDEASDIAPPLNAHNKRSKTKEAPKTKKVRKQ